MGHWIRKLNSVSTAGSGLGEDGAVLDDDVQVGEALGVQNLQNLCSIGVTGRVCLPNSICKLWLPTRNLLKKQRWFLFRTKSR